MPRNNLFLNGRVEHTCRLALVTIKITFCSPLFTLLSNRGTYNKLKCVLINFLLNYCSVFVAHPDGESPHAFLTGARYNR